MRSRKADLLIWQYVAQMLVNGHVAAQNLSSLIGPSGASGMIESEPFAVAAGEELPAELLELGRAISRLPAGQFGELERHYAQVTECFRRRRRILSLVQESLSQLRLDVKYLMFDLEVTRKERDEYRSQLDHAQPDDFDAAS
jgi:hypothetical protein